MKTPAISSSQSFPKSRRILESYIPFHIRLSRTVTFYFYAIVYFSSSTSFLDHLASKSLFHLPTVASQRVAMRAQVSFWYQSYHSNLPVITSWSRMYKIVVLKNKLKLNSLVFPETMIIGL